MPWEGRVRISANIWQFTPLETRRGSVGINYANICAVPAYMGDIQAQCDIHLASIFQWDLFSFTLNIAFLFDISLYAL